MSSGFFYFQGRENGEDCFYKNSIPKQIPLMSSMSKAEAISLEPREQQGGPKKDGVRETQDFTLLQMYL